ncbi:hypothetical protein ILUMI_26746 [Ignelater luminosus]|uniref:Uncharacterized protein n=1 Tax=Ignelater luminosus TaxID=2038154 RepID=A0A8K0C5E3_IGNLU|nr:hypothetical protein ILUMI_26746 [Ignelater luminosus]
MCRITECCFYLPLREGCIAASVIEFIVVIVETVLYFYVNTGSQEGEKAFWIAEICNIQMCSILLFFGSLKEERVCVILHALFLGIILIAEIIFEIVAFHLAFFSRSPDWLIAYKIAYHCFLAYMIPVSISFAVELKDKNYSDSGLLHRHSRPHGQHRLMSSAMSSEIYGM